MKDQATYQYPEHVKEYLKETEKLTPEEHLQHVRNITDSFVL